MYIKKRQRCQVNETGKGGGGLVGGKLYRVDRPLEI